MSKINKNSSIIKASFSLWTQLMNADISANPNKAIKKKWRAFQNSETANASSKSEVCILCNNNDENNGVFICCNEENCSRYFHLDCALDHRAILIDMDQGAIICECDSHRKDVLFCTCKTKYDSSRPMICCDECCDWFHVTCEGFKNEDLESLDSYVCKSCKLLQRNKKSVSKELKELNMEKERRSNWVQDTEKVRGLFLDISDGVCQVVDSISGNSIEPITKEEVNDIVDYLSAPPFGDKVNKFTDPSSNFELELEVLNKLGVHDVINAWLNTALQYQENWRIWEKRVFDISQEANDKFTCDLSGDQYSLSMNLYSRLKELEVERKKSFSAISQSEISSYVILLDVLRVIDDFLKMFHSSNKSDNWLQQVSTIGRRFNPLLKKVNNLSADEELGKLLKSWFPPYAGAINNTLGKLSIWHNKATPILNSEKEWKIDDLEAIIEEGLAFPSLSPIMNELKTLLDRSKVLIENFHILISKDSLDSDQFKILTDEKADIAIVLPIEDALDFIGRLLILLKAIQLATEDSRIPFATLTQLLDESSSIATEFTNSSLKPLLLTTLFQDLTRSTERLQALKTEAEDLLATPSIVLALEKNDVSALTTLESLKVITEEEEFLKFYGSFQVMSAKAETVLNKSLSISLEDLEQLTEDIGALITSFAINKFKAALDAKKILKQELNRLLDLQVTAGKQWSLVSGAMNDVHRGMIVSYEVLQNLLQHAIETGVDNEASREEVSSLMDKSLSLESDCLAKLSQCTEVASESLSSVGQLLDVAKFHAFHASAGNSIKIRYDTFKIVTECQSILSEHSEGEGSSINDHLILKLREIKHSLHKLIEQLMPDSLEFSTLALVKDSFLTFQWKIDVNEILSGHVQSSLQHAKKLLSYAEELNIASVSSPCPPAEYVSLREKITACETTVDIVNNLYKEFQEDTLKDGDEISQQQAMDVVDTEESSSSSSSSAFILSVEKLLKDSSAFMELRKELIERILSVKNEFSSGSIIDESSKKLAFSLNELIDTINRVREVSLSISQAIANTASGSDFQMASIDLKEIIYIVNQLAILSNSCHDFPLIRAFHDGFAVMNREVADWVDKNQALIPLKYTRVKNRNDAVKFTSKKEVLAALNEPIGRSIKTPLHDRFFARLNEIAKLHASLVDFLLAATPLPESLSSQADFASYLRGEIIRLEKLEEVCEGIPLEFSEAIALKWSLEILMWIEKIPLPEFADASAHSTLEEAEQYIADAESLINAIPKVVMLSLIDIGLMACDEDGRPEGFTESAHPAIKNVGDYLAHLEEQVELCRSFQSRAEKAIEADAVVDELQRLIHEMNSLVIFPENRCRRALEKALQAKLHVLEVIEKKANDSKKKSKAVDHSAQPKTTAAKVEQKLERKMKTKPCVGKDCKNALKASAATSFCSDTCAVANAAEYYSAISHYKYCIQAYRNSAAVGSAIIGFPLGKFLSDDISSYEIAQQQQTEVDESSSPRSHTMTYAVRGDLLRRVPKVAASLFPTDRDDASKSQADKSGNESQILRQKAKVSLEDMLFITLKKLNLKGELFAATIFAMDIEAGLYAKHSNSSQVFDLKEYRKHYQMLISNLRRSHNETLVVKLVNGEMTIDQLLGMSAKELADPVVQQEREKQMIHAAQAAKRQSTEELLEDRRREVMAGQAESWRNGGNTSGNSIPVAAPMVATLAFSQLRGDSGDSLDYAVSADSAPSPETDKLRLLDIEQKVLLGKTPTSSSRTPKRPLDADEITRFTSNSVREKHARILIETDLNISDDEVSSSSPAPSPKSSPREGEKREKQPPRQSPEEPVPKVSKASAAIPKVPVPSMRLISRDGSETFELTRPGNPSMLVTGLVNDKRVQGSMATVMNIDGRSKIFEVDKFVNEVLFRNTKIVAVVTFLVCESPMISGATQQMAAYNRFCDEFTKDNRGGISTSQGNSSVQLYIIPPGLQSVVQVLKDMRLDLKERNNAAVLYGVIVAKEPGLPTYTSRNYPTFPYVPSSFAAPSAIAKPALSSKTSSSSSSSSSAAFSRPTAFDGVNLAPNPLSANLSTNIPAAMIPAGYPPVSGNTLGLSPTGSRPSLPMQAHSVYPPFPAGSQPMLHHPNAFGQPPYPDPAYPHHHHHLPPPQQQQQQQPFPSNPMQSKERKSRFH